MKLLFNDEGHPEATINLAFVNDWTDLRDTVAEAVKHLSLPRPFHHEAFALTIKNAEPFLLKNVGKSSPEAMRNVYTTVAEVAEATANEEADANAVPRPTVVVSYW